MQAKDIYTNLLIGGSGGGYPEPTGMVVISVSENGVTEHDVKDASVAEVTVAVPEPSGTEQITITENGTTTHDVKGVESAEITVAVPNPSTGTKRISIAANGQRIEDVTDYASAEITVAVPEPSGSVAISANGTYDIADKAQAVVNVPNPSTGTKTVTITENGTTVEDVTDYASAQIITNVQAQTIDTLDAIFEGTLTEYENSSVDFVPAVFCRYETDKSLKLSFPNAPYIKNYAFSYMQCLGAEFSFPEVVEIYAYAFQGAAKYQGISSYSETLRFPKCTTCAAYAFSYQTLFGTIIFDKCVNIFMNTFAYTGCDIVLLSDTVCPLNSSSGLMGFTGTVYVPDALVDSYKSATNWSSYASKIDALSNWGGDLS